MGSKASRSELLAETSAAPMATPQAPPPPAPPPALVQLLQDLRLLLRRGLSFSAGLVVARSCPKLLPPPRPKSLRKSSAPMPLRKSLRAPKSSQELSTEVKVERFGVVVMLSAGVCSRLSPAAEL